MAGLSLAGLVTLSYHTIPGLRPNSHTLNSSFTKFSVGFCFPRPAPSLPACLGWCVCLSMFLSSYLYVNTYLYLVCLMHHLSINLPPHLSLTCQSVSLSVSASSHQHCDQPQWKASQQLLRSAPTPLITLNPSPCCCLHQHLNRLTLPPPFPPTSSGE